MSINPEHEPGATKTQPGNQKDKQRIAVLTTDRKLRLAAQLLRQCEHQGVRATPKGRLGDGAHHATKNKRSLLYTKNKNTPPDGLPENQGPL